MTQLFIDAGNSRIKWGIADGSTWLTAGSVRTQEASELATLLAGLSEVRAVWLSNVAGAEVARQIQTLCQSQAWRLKFITAQPMQCGVRNHYEQPAQLGSDRWAALIAAWHQVRGACLVVNCGTATTIDALSGEGHFMGGLILPGIDLLRSSLIASTAQLREHKGDYADFPRNTADAVFSGAIQATRGALFLQHTRLGVAEAPLILSGGAAPQLLNQLQDDTLPIHITDNLVLQGMLIIAQEVSA